MGWVGVYLCIMENGIKVGSVVFHRNTGLGIFSGPGTVTKITRDADLGVDLFTVFWQSSGTTWEHRWGSLVTLAEREGR